MAHMVNLPGSAISSTEETCVELLADIQSQPGLGSLLYFSTSLQSKQESPAVADKPARRLRKVRTVYVRAVGL